MSIFKGAGVAIVTPMKPNGEVNYEVFAKLIEFQVANSTDAIIVCGTTGEASTLTHEEHLECIRFCVEKVNKRIPVIAGTGSNCTQTAVYLSQEAEKAGADGLLIVTPYYNKATQKGLKEHYKLIAQAVRIPIILYNIPGRTGGVNLLPETIVSLCEEEPNIVGVKDATDNFIQYAKLMALAKGKVDVYSGMIIRSCRFCRLAQRVSSPSLPISRRSRHMTSVRSILRGRSRRVPDCSSKR